MHIATYLTLFKSDKVTCIIMQLQQYALNISCCCQIHAVQCWRDAVNYTFCRQNVWTDSKTREPKLWMYRMIRLNNRSPDHSSASSSTGRRRDAVPLVCSKQCSSKLQQTVSSISDDVHAARCFFPPHRHHAVRHCLLYVLYLRFPVSQKATQRYLGARAID